MKPRDTATARCERVRRPQTPQWHRRLPPGVTWQEAKRTGSAEVDARVEGEAGQQVRQAPRDLVGDLGAQHVLGLDGAHSGAGLGGSEGTSDRIRAAISSISAVPRPRVVRAAPMRMPEVYQAPFGSAGTDIAVA